MEKFGFLEEAKREELASSSMLLLLDLYYPSGRSTVTKD